MDLFYREYGKGRPLVILHGLLGISDNWVSFGKQAAQWGFKVFIPDQRNHGHSPHHPVFNYYALTDDLSEFLEQHKIIKPLLLGHSMGGKVAMRFALENPGMVDKILVVDTSLRTYVRFDYHLRLIDAMLSLDFNEVSTREVAGIRLSEKIKEPRMLYFLLKNLYWKERGRLGWRPNLHSISEHIESMYDGVFYSTKFANPALFIRGGQSDYVIEEDFPAIFQNFPQAEIKTVDKGTHWVHADEPVIFAQMAREFLTKD
jgi:pimeloyl-ACP methyl ester carboxylesterase